MSSFVFSWSCLKPCLTVCPCVSGSLPVCLSLLSLPQRVSLPLFSEANSTDRCHLQETPAWVSTIHNWSLIKQVCAWLSEWRNFCLSGPKKWMTLWQGFPEIWIFKLNLQRSLVERNVWYDSQCSGRICSYTLIPILVVNPNLCICEWLAKHKHNSYHLFISVCFTEASL